MQHTFCDEQITFELRDSGHGRHEPAVTDAALTHVIRVSDSEDFEALNVVEPLTTANTLQAAGDVLTLESRKDTFAVLVLE